MPTATEIREDKAFVESQGMTVTLLDQARQGCTWYKPDGTALPNLPADMYHRSRYRARGWTLEPPDEAVPSVPAIQSAPVMGTGIEIPVPPRHIHVMREAIGSPCLVLGCTHIREMRNIIPTHKSKGRSPRTMKEKANEQ